MTAEQFNNLLISTNIGEVAYNHHEETPDTESYLTYREVEPFIFWADNEPYYTRERFEVELYTDKRSIAIEQILETTLTNAGFDWRKSNPQRLPDSEQYITLYDTE